MNSTFTGIASPTGIKDPNIVLALMRGEQGNRKTAEKEMHEQLDASRRAYLASFVANNAAYDAPRLDEVS